MDGIRLVDAAIDQSVDLLKRLHPAFAAQAELLYLRCDLLGVDPDETLPLPYWEEQISTAEILVEERRVARQADPRLARVKRLPLLSGSAVPGTDEADPLWLSTLYKEPLEEARDVLESALETLKALDDLVEDYRGALLKSAKALDGLSRERLLS